MRDGAIYAYERSMNFAVGAIHGSIKLANNSQ
jgi:hypothetical protein